MKKALSLNMFLRFTFALLLSVPFTTTAQTLKKYPQGYFRWPLNLSPEIVANMGELRANHWHMGLDVRTAQKVNQPVYAAADGYIAYVGIRPSSYGRFIIINHPNGLSTLYGHLNDFSPALEAYVTQQQYQQQSWAVELDIPKEKFPITKGTFIAYSGTTGASQGPHVHFEIRETISGKCLNPLLFGMPIIDAVPPAMVKLALYDRSKSFYEQTPQIYKLKNTASGYTILPKPVIKTSFQKVSFGLETYDRISGSANQDGIYKARLFLDNELQVEFIIDSISYNDTRYMNAQIDYKYKANGGSYLQHLSKPPGDRSGVYHPAAGDGTIFLTDTAAHKIRIETEDAYNNISSLNFLLQWNGSYVSRPEIESQIFVPNITNVLEKPDFEASLSANSIYDTIIPSYLRSNATETYAVSALHRLNDETTPLHDNMTIRIKPDKIIPDEWKNKLVIRRIGNNVIARPAQWQGNWITATFSDFGSFQAFADVVPPSIGELGSGDTVNLSASTRIIFTPSDNFGIKKFRAELDDQWLRFTNDKSRSWIYIFDERCPYGIHKLKVTVEDIAGNVTTKTWWFKKYPYTAPPKKKKTVKKKGGAKKTAVKKKKK
ncbi:MAG: M23 family metallopeptidase [Chitinophagaceae bacterium]